MHPLEVSHAGLTIDVHHFRPHIFSFVPGQLASVFPRHVMPSSQNFIGKACRCWIQNQIWTDDKQCRATTLEASCTDTIIFELKFRLARFYGLCNLTRKLCGKGRGALSGRAQTSPWDTWPPVARKPSGWTGNLGLGSAPASPRKYWTARWYCGYRAKASLNSSRSADRSGSMLDSSPLWDTASFQNWRTLRRSCPGATSKAGWQRSSSAMWCLTKANTSWSSFSYRRGKRSDKGTEPSKPKFLDSVQLKKSLRNHDRHILKHQRLVLQVTRPAPEDEGMWHLVFFTFPRTICLVKAHDLGDKVFPRTHLTWWSNRLWHTCLKLGKNVFAFSASQITRSMRITLKNSPRSANTGATLASKSLHVWVEEP